MPSEPVLIATSGGMSTNHTFAPHNVRAVEWLSRQYEETKDFWKKSVYETGAAMIDLHNKETKDTKGETYDDKGRKIMTHHTGRPTEQITRDEWEEWYKRTIKKRYINEDTPENKRSQTETLYGVCMDAFSNTAEAPNTDEPVGTFSTRDGGEAFSIEVLGRDGKQKEDYEEMVTGWLDMNVMKQLGLSCGGFQMFVPNSSEFL